MKSNYLKKSDLFKKSDISFVRSLKKKALLTKKKTSIFENDFTKNLQISQYL